MTSTSKLTIHLSPEEVKVAVEDYVLHHVLPKGGQVRGLEVSFNFSEYACEMSGATVEVTQP